MPASLVVGDEALAVQKVNDFGETKLIFPTPLQALGSVAVGDFCSTPPNLLPRLKVSGKRLESGELSVKIDNSGNISSIQTLDDDPVEFISPGQAANIFQLFDDQPLFWDAWDIDPFALETKRDLLRCDSIEIVERGPVRVAIEIIRSFGKSRIQQRISLV